RTFIRARPGREPGAGRAAAHPPCPARNCGASRRARLGDGGAGGDAPLRPRRRLGARRGAGRGGAGRRRRAARLPRTGGEAVMAEPVAEIVGAPPILELDEVSAGYGSFRALFGVSFSVRPGTALAVLGPNGSGKTTVARVCTGLVVPTSGRVRFDHVDVTRLAPWR